MEVAWGPIVTVLVAISAGIAGLTFTIKYTREVSLRRQWERQAEEDSSEEDRPCEEGLRRCKRKLEINVALRKVISISYTYLYRDTGDVQVVERVESASIDPRRH